MSALEAIFAGARCAHKKRGCPVCGSDNVALVQVSVRELASNGQTGSASRNVSVSFCGDHAAELFLALSAELETRRR